jgi:hypothetical protein
MCDLYVSPDALAIPCLWDSELVTFRLHEPLKQMDYPKSVRIRLRLFKRRSGQDVVLISILIPFVFSCTWHHVQIWLMEHCIGYPL